MYSGISESSGNIPEEFEISLSFIEEEEEEEEGKEEEEEEEEEEEWIHFLYMSMYAFASLSREA